MDIEAALGRQPAALSLDPADVDVDKLHAFLTESYWARGRSLDQVRRSIAGSYVASVQRDGAMIGFARAVSDAAVFGYLMDIVVWPGHRGEGLGRRMVRALLDRPELAGVPTWYLRTGDAQGVYAPFGFQPLNDGLFMRMIRPPVAERS
ncbi:GNAT family N-acetyltransferase [Jiella sp. M17.18]|uniref:GNAT family N-acetyltransferase n=1 Tax=Jiella sp. M17.18 TaxID=3234247 RepID=UPI0034DF012B